MIKRLQTWSADAKTQIVLDSVGWSLMERDTNNKQRKQGNLQTDTYSYMLLLLQLYSVQVVLIYIPMLCDHWCEIK